MPDRTLKYRVMEFKLEYGRLPDTANGWQGAAEHEAVIG
jgi:hypothetical protein